MFVGLVQGILFSLFSFAVDLRWLSLGFWFYFGLLICGGYFCMVLRVGLGRLVCGGLYCCCFCWCLLVWVLVFVWLF